MNFLLCKENDNLFFPAAETAWQKREKLNCFSKILSTLNSLPLKTGISTSTSKSCEDKFSCTLLVQTFAGITFRIYFLCCLAVSNMDIENKLYIFKARSAFSKQLCPLSSVLCPLSSVRVSVTLFCMGNPYLCF